MFLDWTYKVGADCAGQCEKLSIRKRFEIERSLSDDR